MPDLLVRDVDAEVKRRLAVRAAQNSRSVQAEARQIIEDAVRPAVGGIVGVLSGSAGADLDGFLTPERHAAREFSLE